MLRDEVLQVFGIAVILPSVWSDGYRTGRRHPVDRGRVEAHKERMLAEVRAYRMRDLSPVLMSCTQARPVLALSLVVLPWA